MAIQECRFAYLGLFVFVFSIQTMVERVLMKFCTDSLRNCGDDNICVNGFPGHSQTQGCVEHENRTV